MERMGRARRKQGRDLNMGPACPCDGLEEGPGESEGEGRKHST
jgi:hypothetical protein